MPFTIVAPAEPIDPEVARNGNIYNIWTLSLKTGELRQFTEALTNWYVRRSRSRFWEEDPDAIDTLHTVLEVTSRLAAPLLPLVTEVIWRGVTGERSVHLTDWPDASLFPAETALVARMETTRTICSNGSALRKAHPGDARPLVYISFGSIAGTMPIAAALRRPWRRRCASCRTVGCEWPQS